MISYWIILDKLAINRKTELGFSKRFRRCWCF